MSKIKIFINNVVSLVNISSQNKQTRAVIYGREFRSYDYNENTPMGFKSRANTDFFIQK